MGRTWRDLDLLVPERLYRAAERLLLRDDGRRDDGVYARAYRRFPETEDDHPGLDTSLKCWASCWAWEPKDAVDTAEHSPSA